MCTLYIFFYCANVKCFWELKSRRSIIVSVRDLLSIIHEILSENGTDPEFSESERRRNNKECYGTYKQIQTVKNGPLQRIESGIHGELLTRYGLFNYCWRRIQPQSVNKSRKKFSIVQKFEKKKGFDPSSTSSLMPKLALPSIPSSPELRPPSTIALR